MVTETEWFNAREDTVENNYKHEKYTHIGRIWRYSFVFIVLYINYTVYKFPSNIFTVMFILTLWFVPPLILGKISTQKDLPEEELVAYHLYNISTKLKSLYESPELVRQDIYRSLRSLDEIISENQEYTIFFTKNVNTTFDSLIDSLGRINTYVDRPQNNNNFNQQVSFKLKSIADSIRANNYIITDAVSNVIKQLSDELTNIEKTEIRIPLAEKQYNKLKKYIIEMPSFWKLISIIAIIV